MTPYETRGRLTAGSRFIFAQEETIAITTIKPHAKTGHTLHDQIMRAIDKEKVEDVVSIDLKGKTAIADYMIVASGTSSRQVTSAARNICDALAKIGVRTTTEGMETGDWVIVDAGDVIVHFFRPEVRAFYNLEKLWATDFATVGYNLYTSK